MSASFEFENKVFAVKESLEIGSTFTGFSDDEWKFVEEVLRGDGAKAEIFVSLMRKANEAGVCNGIDEERNANFGR